MNSVMVCLGLKARPPKHLRVSRFSVGFPFVPTSSMPAFTGITLKPKRATWVGGSGMPTYEYHCSECGKKFAQETSVAEHEAARPACPKCGSQNVVRSFSTVFVQTSKKS
jgi:putative FmdB family regulatory protein